MLSRTFATARPAALHGRGSGHVVYLLAAMFTCIDLMVMSGAIGQRPVHPRVPHVTGGNRRPSTADPAVLELIDKVFHHTVDFIGVQRTQAGSQTSEQKITEDTHGHRRLEYTDPRGFQGDVMLISPNDYYHYHARENRKDVAYWPVEKEVKEQEIKSLVKRGLMTADVRGQETILGRPCVIVALSLQGPGDVTETQRRLWIDPGTGIVMRHEEWNANGQISASYMTSIVVGPDAGVTPQSFSPSQLPKSAKAEPLFPEEQPSYATAAQAEIQAGFHILEPARLPGSYTLNGVWVFKKRTRSGISPTVLLRYSMGVNHFSLFEYPQEISADSAAVTYRRGAGSIQRWVVPNSNSMPVHMIYIGHLSADDVQAIHDTAR